MESKQDILRLRVYKFYSDNLSEGKLFTVAHFRNEGVPKRTIYDILKRFDNGVKSTRMVGSGHKSKFLDKKMSITLRKAFKNKSGVSIRSVAKKFDCSKSSLHRIVRHKLNLHYRKKQVVPYRSEEQARLAKTKCGRLMRKFSKFQFILDDESYFTLGHTSFGGNAGFYTEKVSDTSPDVKLRKKYKFEEKVLVWVAIGPQGVSRPFIRKSGYAINAENQGWRDSVTPIMFKRCSEG